MPYYLRQKGSPLGFQQEGLDGAELSLYGALWCSGVSEFMQKQKLANKILDHVLFSSDFSASPLYPQ